MFSSTLLVHHPVLSPCVRAQLIVCLANIILPCVPELFQTVRGIAVGRHASVGDTLCIIEADKAGTVTAKLVENDQPVEFGQSLFVID
jgi:multidrug resistance efflux pump